LLRWYGAEEELLDGRSYVYPVVTKQGAIRDSFSGTGNSSSGSGNSTGYGDGSVVFDGGAGGIGRKGVGAAVLGSVVLGIAALI
jgi:hypothetical protein